MLTAISAFAQSNTAVRWNQIVGVITAPGIDDPMGGTTDANGTKTRAEAIHVVAALRAGAAVTHGAHLFGG